MTRLPVSLSVLVGLAGLALPARAQHPYLFLEGKKANIADQKARLQAKPNPSKAKKIARDEEKLEAEMTEWSAKEKELLALQFKGEKTEA